MGFSYSPVVRQTVRESTIWKQVMLAVHRIPGVRLFRNSVGQGWVGRSRRMRAGETFRAQGGEVVIMDPRPLHAGLFKGSADGIGWQEVVITQDMVGQRIARFLSVETKAAKGRAKPEQLVWLEQVAKAGGLAVIVRSAGDAVEILQQGALPFHRKDE